MPNRQNVSVGKPLAAGGIYSAPAGTTVPTDAIAPLSNQFVEEGYASDDGLVNSISVDGGAINAWGGDRVMTTRTSREETFKWTYIETNDVVLEQVYGPENVTVEDGDITVLHRNTELPSRVRVFEIALTGDRVKRIVIPDSQITEIGDVTYVDGDPIGYEVTCQAYPDADGVTAYEYIASVDVS